MYVQLYICYIVQVEVAKIEEEKKKLQDTIRAQDDELDKAREALKQSEDSKQATANENCKLLKDLENSRSCNVCIVDMHTCHNYAHAYICMYMHIYIYICTCILACIHMYMHLH